MQTDQARTNVTLWRNSWLQQFKKDLSLSFLHLFNAEKTHDYVIIFFSVFHFVCFMITHAPGVCYYLWPLLRINLYSILL